MEPDASVRSAEAKPKQSYGRRVAQVPTSVPSPAPRTARSCMLVDDSRMIRKITRKIVEKQGYKVSEAENGQEALDKCKQSPPDLIILDWDMPVMTGIEFLASLRAETTLKQPKVIFCTTHSGAKDIHRAIELGADEFCTKPFDELSFLSKMKAIGAA